MSDKRRAPARDKEIGMETRLDALTPDQLGAVIQAMTRYEGWRPANAVTVAPP